VFSFDEIEFFIHSDAVFHDSLYKSREKKREI